MLIGLAPGISWHLWHAHIRGSQALWLWWGDGAGRVLLAAGEGSDMGWRVPVIEILEGLALAAAGPLRTYLGLEIARDPLGPLVLGLRGDPGNSNSSATNTAPLVQPPALAADRPSLRAVAGLASGPILHFLFNQFTPKLKSSIPIATTSTAIFLGRTGTDPLTTSGEQLHQAWQRSNALSRPSRCARRRLVYWRMVASLYRTSAKTTRSDNPQLRECCSAGSVVSIPAVDMGTQRDMESATGSGLGKKQFWTGDKTQGV